MSLEQALKENTEALLAHTAAVNKLLSSTANVAGSATDATTTSTDTDDSADTTEEAPKRERGKPSPGKSKRTAAEVAEDKAADDADAAAAAAAGDADTGDTGTVTFDELKVKLSKWLGEFAKPEDKESPEGTHPEVTARRDAIKAVLTKLGAEKLPDIAKDAVKVGKLDNWLETKAMKADKGHGIGRLASDPEPAGDDDADGGDDELDI